MKQLIDMLGLDPKVTEDDVVAAVAALQATVADAKAANEQRAKDEVLIVEKMSKGLTRSQAITVIERQKQFEADKAKAAKEKASAKK